MSKIYAYIVVLLSGFSLGLIAMYKIMSKNIHNNTIYVKQKGKNLTDSSMAVNDIQVTEQKKKRFRLFNKKNK